MVVERKVIDLEDIAGGDALADELERHPEGVELRRYGRSVAVIAPFAGSASVPAAVPTTDGDPGLDNESARRGRLLDSIQVVGTDEHPLVNRPMTGDEIAALRAAVHRLAPFIDADAMHEALAESRQRDVASQSLERAEG